MNEQHRVNLTVEEQRTAAISLPLPVVEGMTTVTLHLLLCDREGCPWARCYAAACGRAPVVIFTMPGMDPLPACQRHTPERSSIFAKTVEVIR